MRKKLEYKEKHQIGARAGERCQIRKERKQKGTSGKIIKVAALRGNHSQLGLVSFFFVPGLLGIHQSSFTE